jgi:hypothetical protein
MTLHGPILEVALRILAPIGWGAGAGTVVVLAHRAMKWARPEKTSARDDERPAAA